MCWLKCYSSQSGRSGGHFNEPQRENFTLNHSLHQPEGPEPTSTVLHVNTDRNCRPGGGWNHSNTHSHGGNFWLIHTKRIYVFSCSSASLSFTNQLFSSFPLWTSRYVKNSNVCPLLPQSKLTTMIVLFAPQVHLENIALHLIEDRPAPNVTSPGSLPIDLAIPAMTITRDKTGLFSFQSGGENSL